MSQKIHRVGVVGAGAMGAGIAQVAARAGCRVSLSDVAPASLEQARAGLAQTLEALEAKGRLAAGEAAAVLGRIAFSAELAVHAEAELIVEAIVERLEPKQALLRELEAIAPGALLASNTSSLSITALAAALAAPERFAGLHFFNPAAVMPLVEVVPGLATAPETAALLLETARAWGKRPVLARDLPGFIVNRLARPFYGEGWRALEEGAGAPAQIDAALREAGGFRMGPLELGDLIGHDVNAAVARSIFEAYYGRTRFLPSLAQAQLVAAGRLGRKAGRGVREPEDAPTYLEAPPLDAGPLPTIVSGVLLRQGDGRSAAAVAAEAGQPVCLFDWAQESGAAIVLHASSEEALRLGAAAAAGRGRRALAIADRPGGLVLRTWAQLANAAADALRDRAASAADLDTAMRLGVNYPLGPLAWAHAFGPARLVFVLERLAGETGEAMYQPSEILRRAAASGAALI